MIFFVDFPRPAAGRCAAKSEERKARIEREAEAEFLRRMPKQTRHAALLRQRVGQARQHRNTNGVFVDYAHSAKSPWKNKCGMRQLHMLNRFETGEASLSAKPLTLQNAAVFNVYNQVNFIRRMRRDLQRRRAREGGVRYTGENNVVRHHHHRQNDPPRRPASAPTATTERRTTAVAGVSEKGSPYRGRRAPARVVEGGGNQGEGG